MTSNRALDVRDFVEWQEFLDAQGRGFREMVVELDRTFGSDFVEFVCAYAGSWTFIDSVPSDVQREVIIELSQIASELATIADVNHRRIATVRKLGCFLEEVGTTRALDWHRRCGGRVPIVDDDGSVEYCVGVLARDLLGLRLLQSATHPNVVVENHPTYHELFERLDDDSLGSMFLTAPTPDADHDSAALKHFPRSSALLPLWADGTCQTLQFHDVVLALATNTIIWKYLPYDVVEEVQSATIERLQKARRISLGEKVVIPTLVSLTGVKLDADIEVTGHSGLILRRSNPLDPGCLNGTTRVWAIAEIDTECYYLHNNRQSSRVHQSDFPVFPERDPDHSSKVQTQGKELSLKVDHLRIALLLASTEDVFDTCDISRTLANPLLHLGGYVPPDLAHNNVAHVLTVDECLDFEDWFELVTRIPKHLNSPMRQLLRSTRRAESVERLLSAVTTWDALIGSYPDSDPKTPDQVAVLLQASVPASHGSLQSELSEIYAARAAIVYGATDPYENQPGEYMAALADRALRVSIEVFRCILARNELANSPDPKSRSQVLTRLTA